MDNWIIATISAFVSLVATTAITAIVSTVIKKVVEKKLDASFKAQSAHLKEHDELMKMRADLEHKKRNDEILAAIRKEMAPVSEGISTIKQDLEADRAATIISIRSNMKQLRDRYLKQGFADVGDVATWNELYNNYSALGGNHFKEYVDQWKEEVNSLPHNKDNKK